MPVGTMKHGAAFCLPRIAVVEAATDLRESIADHLRGRGFSVWVAACGADLLRHLPEKPADVVVLDVKLPGEDGFAIAQRLHGGFRVGIVMVSARQRVDDRLTGLRSGADVYLVKPLDMRELVANIQSVFRRLNRLPADTPAAPLPSEWGLEMQVWKLRAPDGAVLALTPKEFLVARTLVEAGDEVVSKSRLATVLGGERGAAAVDYHAIDVLIARMRKKCLDTLGCALPIRTVTGIGYLLTVPVQILRD